MAIVVFKSVLELFVILQLVYRLPLFSFLFYLATQQKIRNKMSKCSNIDDIFALSSMYYSTDFFLHPCAYCTYVEGITVDARVSRKNVSCRHVNDCT